MSNKQKLPKHITAHESLIGRSAGCVILKNEVTERYAATFVNTTSSLIEVVELLNDGGGWHFDKQIVGKQIVF